MTLPVIIRGPQLSDRGLVFSGWKESFAGSAWARLFRSRAEYYAMANLLLDRVIPRCELFIACLEEDRATSVGWLAMLDGAAEYLYVKARFAADEELRARISDLLCSHAGVAAPPPWDPFRALERCKK